MQPQQEQNYWQPDTLSASANAPLAEPTVTEVRDDNNNVPSAISWQASEFIHHEKDGAWFLALLAVAVVLLVLDFFVVKSWTFGVLIVVMAAAAVIVGKRPPRTLNYSLSNQGLRIDDKSFSFHDFRAFGVIQESALYSIRLIPNKRFMPMVSLYFPAEQGERIVDLIGSVLPMEHIERDPIDRIVEKIRF